MSRPCVRAPGKAILCGEYAVLHGAPAIAVAVDRDVVARRAATASALAVRRAPRKAHAAQEPAARRARRDVRVDSSALYDGGEQARARLVGGGHRRRRRAGAGRGRAHARRPRALFAIADAAHAAAQGTRGSGVDVAAASTAAPSASCARHGDVDVRAGRPARRRAPHVRLGRPAGVDGASSSAASRRSPRARRRATKRPSAAWSRTRTPSPPRSTPTTPAAWSRAADAYGAGDGRARRRRRLRHRHPRRTRSWPRWRAVTAAPPSRRAPAAATSASPSPSATTPPQRLREDCARGRSHPAVARRSGTGPSIGECMTRSSRIPGFYKLPLDERRAQARRRASASSRPQLVAPTARRGDRQPHGRERDRRLRPAARHRRSTSRSTARDYLVPMCVEEPSVIAAASNAAKMIREGGGFVAEADDPIMISQVQLDATCATPRTPSGASTRTPPRSSRLRRRRLPVADRARRRHPRHRGAHRSRRSTAREPGMLGVHLHVDCRDAMGANLVNTIAEAVRRSPGRARRRATSGCASCRTSPTVAACACSCRVPARCARHRRPRRATRCATASSRASRFAELDPYRAATHNKGIMNGVDAVVHRHRQRLARRRGRRARLRRHQGRARRLRPARHLARRRRRRRSMGRIELPMAVGTVGGTLRVHPGARLALEILGVERASELGMVMACGRAGLEPGRAARDGLRRHPARPHVAARALGRAARGRHRRAGRSRRRGAGARSATCAPKCAQQILERLRAAPTATAHKLSVGGAS